MFSQLSGKESGGKPSRAVIWDMDGVIADTGPYHFKAWQKVFRARGVDFTEEDFKRNFGQRNDTIIRYALGQKLTQAEVEDIAREKEETFRSLARGNIRALPGAIELLRALKDRGFKIALASSAPMENIRLVTQSLGIYEYFDAIVFGHEVTEGKPSPQGFLLAAQKLGIEPARCVVIEDAIAGVAAARRAGMHSIAVTNTHSPGNLAEAHLIVDSLQKVTVSDIERLLNSS